jgi:hypothetical protein
MTDDSGMAHYSAGIFGDYRRAAAIISHHARGDGDGVQAVIDDAAEKGRSTELLLAVVGLYQMVLPNVTDKDIVGPIQQLAAKLAAEEDNENQEGNEN